jgi:hypothetical protein
MWSSSGWVSRKASTYSRPLLSLFRRERSCSSDVGSVVVRVVGGLANVDVDQQLPAGLELDERHVAIVDPKMNCSHNSHSQLFGIVNRFAMRPSKQLRELDLSQKGWERNGKSQDMG